MERRMYTPAECLADHEFQDDLAMLRIMVRESKLVKPNLDDPSLVEDTLANKVRRKLIESYGYVVPNDEIAMFINNSQTKRSLSNIKYLLYEMRQSFGIPISHHFRVGASMGVRSFNLTLREIPSIYRLWLQFEEAVPEEELVYATYGLIDQPLTAEVRKRMSTGPMKKFQSTEADLTRFKARDGGYYYSLKPREETSLIDYLPPYLGFGFQNWLASPEVGILQRKPFEDFQSPNEMKEGLIQDLLKLLVKHWGYLLTLDCIGWQIYHQPDEYKRVKSLIHHTRETLKDPSFIYSKMGLGIAAGVQQLTVPNFVLPILHRLRRDENQFVSFRALSTNQTIPVLHNGIRMARQALENSDYEIVTDPNLGYKLQRITS